MKLIDRLIEVAVAPYHWGLNYIDARPTGAMIKEYAAAVKCEPPPANTEGSMRIVTQNGGVTVVEMQVDAAVDTESFALGYNTALSDFQTCRRHHMAPTIARNAKEGKLAAEQAKKDEASEQVLAQGEELANGMVPPICPIV